MEGDMKTSPVRVGTIVILALMISACAAMKSSRAPEADLGKIATMYVVKLPPDGRGINRVIADQLNLIGYKATTGTETDTPQDVDAIVTYQDRWTWDITMYMLRLNIQIRDPKTSAAWAEGESYRPSLQRKSPSEMAKEVLESIFPGKK